jgi:hypothetical protein
MLLADAARNFSCMPFERYNGRLGMIHTGGQQGGMKEMTIMKTSVHRKELKRTLQTSSLEFFNTELLQSIEGRKDLERNRRVTKLSKIQLEKTTFSLFFTHLNGLRNPLEAHSRGSIISLLIQPMFQSTTKLSITER